MANDKRPTGAMGVAPPPDAPQEHIQPLQPETIAFQQDQARRNEKVLPPFNPPPLTRPVQAIPQVPVQKASIVDDIFGPTPVPKPIPKPDPEQVIVDQVEDALSPITDEDRERMPAASNSESPSRGILPNLTPQQTGGKWEGISKGGFSDMSDGQYFPLDGTEAWKLAQGLMEQLIKQAQNDMRFSIALTYPRIRMKLKLEVQGHAEDNPDGFTIEKVFVPKEGKPGSTPLEVASQRADEIVFVVEAVAQEFTPEGESETPPDEIRDRLKLPKPRKQMVKMGGRPTHFDVAVQP